MKLGDGLLSLATGYCRRLCHGLRINTAWPPGALPGDAAAEKPLKTFQEFLAESYPAFHRCAQRWTLSPYGVVYRWPGWGDAGSSGLDPALLLGHYDVVPAEGNAWTVDPFGGEFLDGFIYGRGALDMKSITLGILESADTLCRRGFKPRRDVWIALGGDEERTGILGARETAAWMAREGLRFSFILDEGTPVAVNQISGISWPLALVGVEEKGYLSAALSVDQAPGHASQPPEQQAAAILSRALLRLSRRPFPWLLTPVAEECFRRLGDYAPGIAGWVMHHARLLGPLFFRAAGTSPSSRALLRTTMAITQLSGSAADNVLPSAARAVLNLRLLPPWTVDSALERLRSVIADRRVAVTVHGLATDPVRAGPVKEVVEGPGWQEIRSAVDSAFGSAVLPGDTGLGMSVPALPFLMLATTDSRHFKDLSPRIFRFSPQILTPDDLSRIHGHDERISLENMDRCLGFYTALMEQL
jgi:carboxypeptidase PM20D1